MAAGYLPPPGSEHHNEWCAEMAAKLCESYCGEPIGYVYGFYQDQADDEPAWSKLCHAVCAQRHERERRDGEPHDFTDYARRIRQGTLEQAS